MSERRKVYAREAENRVKPDPWTIEALLRRVYPVALRRRLSDAIDDRVADERWDAAWDARHDIGDEG